jgi:hypothetical protein
MRFAHQSFPGRGVRLGYCMNAFRADALDAILEGLRTITVPLRERIAAGKRFGVGLYLPAAVVVPADAQDLERQRAGMQTLQRLLDGHDLDPFTFNAFPYGRFHADGLKRGVFRPGWNAHERIHFTESVAGYARSLGRRTRERGQHLSISTHSGMHSGDVRSDEDLQHCRSHFAHFADRAVQLEAREGVRTVLALEAEPRANCNDTRELASFRRAILEQLPGHASAVQRSLGTCLDTCHAAVEFERAVDAFDHATAHGAPLGKLQYSSAVVVREPGRNRAGREQLFGMDEPRYLHQVTGRGPDGLLRADDLPEVRRAIDAGDERWLACDEWRCHFHVPVDLDRIGEGGVETTRSYADELLAHALGSPERWGTDELHVEIETYTWDVLPRAARGAGELVDGLEREYRHVVGVLETNGWRAE